jgi:hypothetical protein
MSECTFGEEQGAEQVAFLKDRRGRQVRLRVRHIVLGCDVNSVYDKDERKRREKRERERGSKSGSLQSHSWSTDDIPIPVHDLLIGGTGVINLDHHVYVCVMEGMSACGQDQERCHGERNGVRVI